MSKTYVVRGGGDSHQVESLSRDLNCSILEDENVDIESDAKVIRLSGGEASLTFAGQTVSINFNKYHHRFKVTKGFAKSSLLAKAIGYSGKSISLLFDLTGGLAKDSLQLAAFCEKVIMVEKQPILACMARHAAELVIEEDVIELVKRVSIENLDSVEFLNNYNCVAPEVIYIDPMYPEKKKSSLPKKEMQVLQALVGPDSLTREFFDKALQVASKRVVVKRPPKGEKFLSDFFEPNFSVKGKSVRYDVYLAARGNS